MKNLCIIPARGGSKRIPRKNVKAFLGKPIISYSIEVALKSGLFDEVMVSTEDEEIAEIAKSYGASFPFYRSQKAAGDHVMTIDVMTEVVEEYRKRGLASKVIDMAVEFAKEHHCYKAILQSGITRTEAHQFYENKGFSGSSKKAFDMRLN